MIQRIKVSAAIVAAIGVVACSTNVNITTQPAGAKVYMNEKYLGDTPLTVERSNLVFNNYNVRLTKDGYRTINTALEKEAKAGPIIGGILVLIPFFWCYGPQDQQSFTLEPGKAMLLIPENMKVAIDGQQGTLQPGLNIVAAGKHTVKIIGSASRTKIMQIDLKEKETFAIANHDSRFGKS